MNNYAEFKHGLEYLFTDTIPGYRLHALPEYPYAVKSDDPRDVIVVEVFRATNPTVEQAIHELELGVGYAYDEITLRGKATGIYCFGKPGSEPLVQGGDWVKFFGSR